MTLFGLGTAAVDFRITTEDFGPDYRDKLLARETTALGGGVVANALHQAALLGSHVEWLGKLGYDVLGSTIVTNLQAHRVGTKHVIYDPVALSPFNVAVYAGEAHRRVGGFLLPNCLGDTCMADIDTWSLAVLPGDWVLVEVGEIPLPVVKEFCRRTSARTETASEAGGESARVKLVLDVDLDPIRQCVDGTHELLSDLMRLCDYILPNRDAMQSVYPDMPPELLTQVIAEQFDATVVTTAGEQGCYYTDRGQVRHRAALPVEVADTVGAGDAFHGGFLHALMCGVSLDEAVRVGTVCGALNCTAFGPRAGMPDEQRLAEAMRGVL